MIRHIFKEALGALGHYKLRSALTTLSIVWGVVSLVLLLAYGQGFEHALVRAFQQIGKDLVVIFPGQTSLQAGGERSGRRIVLELADVKALQEGVPTIEAISPEVSRRFDVSYQTRTRSYNVAGVYAAFGRIRNMEMAAGRFLSEEDVQDRQRVAVIGENVRKELFSGMPAVGSEIKIEGARFRVIGVLRKKTQISNYTAPDDMSVFLPYTTLSTLANTRQVNNIVLTPANNLFRQRIAADVRAALARQHHFSVQDTRAVEILEWNEFMGLITTMSVALQVLLAVIGTLTLSIGAVGVVNIMLVSVAERTREIGVLKALGARRIHILTQILFEGLVLTLAGGAMGFILATLLVKAIGSLPFLGALFEDTSGQGDIYLRVSLSALLISTGVLVVVGLIAGLIPALRASKLHPIQALRSD